MNIFVGNLGDETTEKQLEILFTPFGEIKTVKIIIDNYTRRSRGFGFVEMPDQANAETAVEKLNRYSFNGQILTVNEAKAKSGSESFGRRRN